MRKIFCICIFLLTFSSFAGNKVYNIDDSEIDSVKTFKNILDKIKIENVDGSSTIILKKGVYNFNSKDAIEREYYISNHDQVQPKKVGIIIENLSNVTIDGQGSEFLFSGRMLPIIVSNSKNIKLKNFSIDFKDPKITQLTVTSNDGSSIEFKVSDETKYRVDGTKFTAYGDDWKISPWMGIAFHKDKNYILPQTSDMSVPLFSSTDLGNGKIKVVASNSNLEVGTNFVARSWDRPTPGIVIDACVNTSLDKVTVHFSEGMALLAQMSENIYLNQFKVAIKEGSKRAFTTQADATHFSGCKGEIISQNGFYESMMDDAINVHGTYLKIIRKINNKKILAKYMHHQAYGFSWGFAGDTIQFVEPKSMNIDKHLNYIEKIVAKDLPENKGVKVFEIEFKNDIPKNVKKNFGVENLTWTPSVVFKNNIVKNNRARGALFSTPKKVVVENNTFDHVSGTGILLCGDCNGWYETGSCRDVTIRNNKFINNLTSMFQFTTGVISIYPEIPKLAQQKNYFHENILIENNEFVMFDRPVLYAKSTDGITFKNNTIKLSNDFKPFHKNDKTYLFEKCINIKIENNSYENGYKYDENKDLSIK